MYRLAYIRFYQENINETKLLLERALAIQDEQTDWRGAIRTLSFLASVEQYDLGNAAAAMAYGERAMQLCDEYQEQAARATILETISDIQMDNGDFDKARLSALESLDLLKKHGDRIGQAKLNYKLSQVEVGLGNYKQALSTCQESLQLTEEIGDTWGSVFVLWQLGNAYQFIQQPNLAREAWERGLGISQTFPGHPKQKELLDLLNT